MKRLAARVAGVLYLSGLFSLLVVPVANAYIDPGSGSFLFQAAIGAMLAASLSVKVFWRRIRSFFSSSESQDS